MALIPFVVAYVCLGVFVIAVAARVALWSRMPVHVRWELYPVAHEGERARYGGSYLEQTDWWKRPRHRSLWGELKVMVPEILFLVALREHNRRLWLVSFPFHFGLYLVIGCTLLMMGMGFIALVAPAALLTPFGQVLRYAITASGYLGLGLGLLGAAGLLWRRLTDPELRDFTAPADRFNLVFFISAFGCALVHALVVDPDFSRVSEFTRRLVVLQMTTSMADLGSGALMTAVTVTLLSLLVAYIPLTHMSHFVGKYFAYHAIRWGDTPNLPGSDQPEIQRQLGYLVSWSASHIEGAGKKSWGELATEQMGGKKK